MKVTITKWTCPGQGFSGKEWLERGNTTCAAPPKPRTHQLAVLVEHVQNSKKYFIQL
jgi:hypothetical protein